MNTPVTVHVQDYEISNTKPITILAGPCAMESREHALMMAFKLKAIGERLGVNIVYKTSFDKANRTSFKSARGIGLEAASPIFREVRKATGLPVITDVHMSEHCAPVAEVVDIIQIPAFLCRQSDLLQSAARTGKALNIKKGQFLAPWDMVNVAV